jgi:hydrogenase nickel incorporation protein HypA/HybF
MHEWALAEAVVETAIEESRKEGLEAISEITVQIGELQQIELEVFHFALDEIAKAHDEDSLLTNAKVHLETERAIFKCRVCGTDWDYRDSGVNEDEGEAIHFAPEVAHVYVRCPSCKSPDFEVIQGRGVLLKAIKGKR